MLIVRSPVRISFAGGGTDMPVYYEKYDGAVISTAINKYFYTVLQKRTDGQVQVISSDLRVMETWEDIAKTDVASSSLAIPLAAVKELGFPGLSFDMFMSSEIPPGTGLGSSASVCVNVLRALSSYLHVSMSRYELAERAYHIARDVLKKPVGKQDEYAAAFGGLNHIQFCRDGNTKVDPLELDRDIVAALEANLLLFFTGASHDSWRILKHQEISVSADTGQAVEHLHRIRELVDRVATVLRRGDLYSFGKLLDEGWHTKRAISQHVSTSRIDDLYRLAQTNGAIGGKITGAGGGGFLLLYCPRDKQKAVREAFAREGIRDMGFRFDFQGAHTVVNDPFIDADERCGTRWIFYKTGRTQASASGALSS
ncbi:MAG TPA: GHMP kinase [Clostridia bacterium]|nr:GHMP kinase [Clostridia bacterium]